MNASDEILILRHDGDSRERHRRRHRHHQVAVTERCLADLHFHGQRSESGIEIHPKAEHLLQLILRGLVEIADAIRHPDTLPLHADFDRVVLPVAVMFGRVTERIEIRCQRVDFFQRLMDVRRRQIHAAGAEGDGERDGIDVGDVDRIISETSQEIR